MLSKFINVGSKVDLVPIERVKYDNLGENNKRVYETKVYDILSEDRVEVLMPMEQSKLILLPVDSEYDVSVYEGKLLYQFDARIIDRYKSNNVYIIVLELTSNVRKVQRREFYRFSCALDMSSRSLEQEEVAAVENRDKTTDAVPVDDSIPLRRSIIVDISGGGVRFISNYKYEKDQLIYCKYNLTIDNMKKEYCLVGKVLAVKEVEHKPGTFEHRVQYMDINMEEREEIIRYIFQEERKNRRKESGF
ncbi:MAG: flagellar brake protein [Lachnospiraceae bacterium]|nr:flagellar brake protein [Lachnospiraceae bacterium]MBR4992984.1 flagellar brake protein [Lachnospiraceae bacterium]